MQCNLGNEPAMSLFQTHTIAGSKLVVRAAESHEFKPGADEYLCELCNRPRALHTHDGFKASHDFSELDRVRKKWVKNLL